jgi:hypothetical protein
MWLCALRRRGAAALLAARSPPLRCPPQRALPLPRGGFAAAAASYATGVHKPFGEYATARRASQP